MIRRIFFCSLIFLTHPLQTQAVTYIVQRMSSLSTLFYLASALFYIRSRVADNRRFYVAAIFSAFCAVFSKETSFTLPFVLLVSEWMCFGLSREERKKQILCLLEDIKIDIIKIGMVSNPDTIKTITKTLKESTISPPIVLDPVMISKSGHSLLKKSATTLLIKKLLPIAFITTPNLPEAEILTKKKRLLQKRD